MWFPGSCGIWSPALVNWYAGPGWIGWVPRTLGNGANPCPSGSTCGTAVSNGVFKTGHPIIPSNLLPVDVASGNRIARPEIPSDRQAMLPGRIVSPPAEVTGLTRVLGTGFVAQHTAPHPESEIVYDPTQGRYVNRTSAQNVPKLPTTLPVRPLPLSPSTRTISATRGVQPPSGTAPKAAPTPAVQSHYWSLIHHSAPSTKTNSSTASRSGGSATNGQTKSSSGSSRIGASGGAGWSGSGGMSGGSHAGGAGAGGGHR